MNGDRYLLLFDDHCGWCSGWAAWIARHANRDRLALAPLSGATARPFVGRHPPTDTMVLVAREQTGGHRLYTRSEAVFRTARALGWPWRMLGLFRVLPRKLTDGMYGWMAANRHRLSCPPNHRKTAPAEENHTFP